MDHPLLLRFCLSLIPHFSSSLWHLPFLCLWPLFCFPLFGTSFVFLSLTHLLFSFGSTSFFWERRRRGTSFLEGHLFFLLGGGWVEEAGEGGGGRSTFFLLGRRVPSFFGGRGWWGRREGRGRENGEQISFCAPSFFGTLSFFFWHSLFSLAPLFVFVLRHLSLIFFDTSLLFFSSVPSLSLFLWHLSFLLVSTLSLFFWEHHLFVFLGRHHLFIFWAPSRERWQSKEWYGRTKHGNSLPEVTAERVRMIRGISVSHKEGGEKSPQRWTQWRALWKKSQVHGTKTVEKVQRETPNCTRWSRLQSWMKNNKKKKEKNDQRPTCGASKKKGTQDELR